MLKVLVMAAPLVLSTAAFAQPSRVSDAEFIAAARCQALMASPALGRQDTRGIDQVLDAQKASAFQRKVHSPPVLRSESRPGALYRTAMMRQGHELRPGQDYYILYLNNKRAVRSGLATDRRKPWALSSRVPAAG